MTFIWFSCHLAGDWQELHEVFSEHVSSIYPIMTPPPRLWFKFQPAERRPITYERESVVCWKHCGEKRFWFLRFISFVFQPVAVKFGGFGCQESAGRSPRCWCGLTEGLHMWANLYLICRSACQAAINGPKSVCSWPHCIFFLRIILFEIVFWLIAKAEAAPKLWVRIMKYLGHLCQDHLVDGWDPFPPDFWNISIGIITAVTRLESILYRSFGFFCLLSPCSYFVFCWLEENMRSRVVVPQQESKSP